MIAGHDARPGRRPSVSVVAAVAFGVLVALLITAVFPLGAAVHKLSAGDVGQGLIVVTFAAVGVMVAIRQPRNLMGWILLAAGFFFIASDDASYYAVLVYRQQAGWRPLGPLSVLAQPSWAPAIVLFGLAVLLFPDAELPAGGWRWIMWIVLGTAALWTAGAFAVAIDAIASHQIDIDSTGNLLQLDHPTGEWAWWGVVQDVFFPVLGIGWLSSIARQVLTYRRGSGDRRLQLKWLMVGASMAMVGGAFSVAMSDSTVAPERIAGEIGTVGFAALPLSIGVAILRYRLFDIDRLISRTLSYALVTAVLVGLYVSIVVVTTDVLSFSSPVAVTASTLAAAALFNPIRRRMQRLVDRRFNRTSYDAESMVAMFSLRLRESVDLDAVRADLLDVVARAVEPTHAAVWVARRPG